MGLCYTRSQTQHIPLLMFFNRPTAAWPGDATRRNWSSPHAIIYGHLKNKGFRIGVYHFQSELPPQPQIGLYAKLRLIYHEDRRVSLSTATSIEYHC